MENWERHSEVEGLSRSAIYQSVRLQFLRDRVPRAPAPPKTSKLQPGIHCFKSQTCSIRRNFLENSNVSAEHASHGSKVTFYSNKAIEDPKLKIGPHMTLTSYYYPHNIRISATAKQVTTLAVAPHLCHAFQPIPLPSLVIHQEAQSPDSPWKTHIMVGNVLEWKHVALHLEYRS